MTLLLMPNRGSLLIASLHLSWVDVRSGLLYFLYIFFIGRLALEFPTLVEKKRPERCLSLYAQATKGAKKN